ncbi:MAG: hypothetical protein HZB46_06160 [Solirubrobacterales bacterium]|nr:hypothetical protein [Solirubrobacterales bacterium]
MHDPLPDWLREAVEPALADLQLPTPIDLRVAWDAREQMLSVIEPDRVTSYTPLLREPASELLVDLAGWLQEQVFPESEGAWGEARPACPGHAHMADPEVLDGAAWWICPVDGRRIGRIGTLAG